RGAKKKARRPRSRRSERRGLRLWSWLRPYPSLAPTRDHVGFVVEPEPAVFAQNLAGGVEIASAGDDLGEPVVFDLRHVDCGVPRRKQRGGADRLIRDLARQGVHLVAEQRTVVGISIEVEIAPGGAELVLHRLHDLMAV